MYRIQNCSQLSSRQFYYTVGPSFIQEKEYMFFSFFSNSSPFFMQSVLTYSFKMKEFHTDHYTHFATVAILCSISKQHLRLLFKEIIGKNYCELCPHLNSRCHKVQCMRIKNIRNIQQTLCESTTCVKLHLYNCQIHARERKKEGESAELQQQRNTMDSSIDRALDLRFRGSGLKSQSGPSLFLSSHYTVIDIV